MLDAVGTSVYAYTTGDQLWTEEPPSSGLWRARGTFATDTVTNTHVNRLRTGLALQQPTGFWTNGLTMHSKRTLNGSAITLHRGSRLTLKRHIICALSPAIMLCLFGCTAAYNSRNELSPDERHSVCCYVRGAFGRNYYSESNKKVIVTVCSRGANDSRLLEEDYQRQKGAQVITNAVIPGLEMKTIFEKHYRIKGSSVSWRPIWGTQNDVAVVFYDGGLDTPSDGDIEDSAPKRVLRTLRFRFDDLRFRHWVEGL